MTVYCIECRLYLPDTLECRRTERLDLVTKKPRYVSCADERMGPLNTDCGPDGRFFEMNIPDPEPPADDQEHVIQKPRRGRPPKSV